MATIDNFVMCQSIGEAWKKAILLWQDWVTDNAKTISRGVGTALSCKTLLMQYVLGADTYKYHLACADIPSGAASVPIPYLLQSPGMRAMPSLLTDVYGTTTTKTSFESVIRGLRSNILETLGGHGTVTWTTTSYAAALTGLDVHRYYTPLRLGMVTAMDAIQLYVKGATWASTLLNDAQVSDGLVSGPAAYANKPADMAGIVLALNDLIYRDVQTTLNNGEVTVLQSSGDIVV